MLVKQAKTSGIYYKDEASKAILPWTLSYIEVVFMIERLMNLECSYGEPEYRKLSEEISKLKDSLCDKLDQDGKKCLEQMTDAYVRRETAVLRDAFADGFWTAVELLLEFECRNHGIGRRTP